MPKLIAAVVAALTVVAVLSSPKDSGQMVAARASADASAGSRDIDLNIIAFEEDHRFPDDFTAAVEQAGGEVVDRLDPLGVALVRSDHENFLNELARSDVVTGAARNHAVGVTEPDLLPLPHRWAGELLSEEERRIGQHNALERLQRGPDEQDQTAPAPAPEAAAREVAVGDHQLSAYDEPLAARLWGINMVGATPDAAHQTATGQGVSVGIIDSGIDASHPDLAPNFDRERSRDFVNRGGPAGIDPAGHGTHVAGIVGAARNDLGIAGVAPDVSLVNLRAGQDSGHFFVYEVVSALVAAGDQGLDVVNMSFYTDPWMYNCASQDDYITGTVTDEELAEQVLVRQVMFDALRYAHDRGVTLVAAAGNEHLDMSAPERHDPTSPAVPAGSARPRTVSSNCLDLPAEGPNVITVSSVGPSGNKADYANYGLGSIDLTAPGGWLGDHAGTPQYQQADNLVLSTFPLEAAQRRMLADGAGQPRDVFSLTSCNDTAGCGFYTYLQGTSMSAPFVAGVAALVIQRHGRLHPDQVAAILTSTATDRPCPPGGSADYTAAGRPSSWNAACVGTASENSLHGHGIVNALAAAS